MLRSWGRSCAVRSPETQRGKAGASGASWPAFPGREISRWKKQARSGDIRRLLSAWRTAPWAYWKTPQQWNNLGARMVTGHSVSLAALGRRRWWKDSPNQATPCRRYGSKTLGSLLHQRAPRVQSCPRSPSAFKTGKLGMVFKT